MRLITFEGIDGSGKSTQAALLRDHLQEQGCDPLLVRDPGGTALSEHVRQLVLTAEQDVAPMAELMLFCAARAQLVDRQIRPALHEGRIVLCDRFYDSTTAYQGGGRGVAGTEWLNDLHRRVTGGLVPDRTYWVALDPQAASERRAAHGGSAQGDDRMEAAGDRFRMRVAAAYARLAEQHPDRILRLDGSCSAEAIHARICEDIERLLPSLSGTAGSGDGSSDR